MRPTDGVLVLYRGESLSARRLESVEGRTRVDEVRKFHLTGQGLWTRLANGGNPYAIQQFGLAEGVGRHIARPETFSKTHFLSFTSQESVALRFACSPPVEDPDDVAKAIGSDEEWQFTKYAVFKLRASERERLSEGIYRLRYNTGANTAILIDAVEYLVGLPRSVTDDDKFRQALALARNDAEWLVLPADVIPDGTLSAFLRKGSDLEVDHYVESAFFIDRH